MSTINKINLARLRGTLPSNAMVKLNGYKRASGEGNVLSIDVNVPNGLSEADFGIIFEQQREIVGCDVYSDYTIFERRYAWTFFLMRNHVMFNNASSEDIDDIGSWDHDPEQIVYFGEKAK